MNGVARASSRTLDATSTLAPTRAWVVPAPIQSASLRVSMPSNSAT
jgi:hypothetical protein